jgi:hypothetical protein
MCEAHLPDDTIGLAWWRSRRRHVGVLSTPSLVRLRRRLHLDTVGLAIGGCVLSVAVVALVRSLIRSVAVVATLLRLRGVLRRRLLVVVVIVVVGLCIGTGARSPASAVEGLMASLAATTGGYAAGSC